MSVSRRRQRMLVRTLIALSIGAVAWYVFADVPWRQVADAIGQVSPADLGVLLILALARVALLALPAVFFMPDLTLIRATRNELAGSLVQNFAPPPADIGVRYAMLRSWHLKPADGIAALTLGGLLYYAARLAAPGVGFVVVLLGGRVDNQYAVAAVGSGVLCALLASTILLLARSRRSAALVARYSAAAVGRVRRVDAAHWEHTAVSFGDRIRDRLSSGWAKAVAALAALLAVEASIFVVALRAVGVSAQLLPTAEAAGAYLVAYPLTMFPFSGIVLMDGALVELLATRADPATEAQLVAGVVLWRVVALLLPFLLGLLVLVHWRSRERGSIAGNTRSPS